MEQYLDGWDKLSGIPLVGQLFGDVLTPMDESWSPVTISVRGWNTEDSALTKLIPRELNLRGIKCHCCIFIFILFNFYCPFCTWDSCSNVRISIISCGYWWVSIGCNHRNSHLPRTTAVRVGRRVRSMDVLYSVPTTYTSTFTADQWTTSNNATFSLVAYLVVNLVPDLINFVGTLTGSHTSSNFWLLS